MNKKHIRAIGCVLGSFCLMINTYAASIGTVKVDGLNIRTGPSTSYSVVKKVNTGEQLSIESQEGDWLKVKLPNTSRAYVHSDFVDVVEEKTSVEGVVTVNGLNMRSDATINSNVITKLDKGNHVEVFEKTGDWYRISFQGKDGYIFTQYAEVDEVALAKVNSTEGQNTGQVGSDEKEEELVAVVDADILNIRQSPSTTSTKLGKTYFGNVLDLVEKAGDWYKISNGQITGYVHGDYVSIKNKNDSSIAVQGDSGDTAALRQQIIEYAKQFIGTPYVWGGNSLTRGVDCSGFTQQVYRYFGINISRTSYLQINDGVRVSRSQMQPGDMAFFGYNGRISHVGIYIGDGKMVHANDYSTGVIISRVDTNAKPFLGATRVVK